MNKLILISGPPGVGKSTLANELAEKLSVFIVDKDCIDEPFSPNDRGELYSQNIEPRSLQVMLNIAERNLKFGDVILDAPWTHIMLDEPKWQSKIKELSQKTKSHLKIIELVIDEHNLKERIFQRGLVRDQIKLTENGWDEFIKRDQIEKHNPLKHFKVDANLPLDDLMEDLIGYVTEITE